MVVAIRLDNHKKNSLEIGDLTETIKKKRYWDKIVVGTILLVGFSVIMMKITGYWPCDVINFVSGKFLC